jgi:biopolymer transport protein ExbB
MKSLTFLILAASLSLFSLLSAENELFEETLFSLDQAFFEEEQPSIAAPFEIVEVQLTAANPAPELAIEEEPQAEVALAIEEPPFQEPPREEVVLLGSILPQKIQDVSREAVASPSEFKINFTQVFKGAPVIYSILFVMSMTTVFIWLYSFLRLKAAGSMSETLLKQLRQKLHSNQYEEALALCSNQDTFFCKMLGAGIAARNSGLGVMLETMKTEGKRATITFWQRLSLLNDIALIAPMVGLLGTVLGMFYAFYDLNRSMESFSILFDGLGISVGTTVAGMIVAILALMLQSIAKYRLVRVLVRIENEAQSFATLIDNKTPFAP